MLSCLLAMTTRAQLLCQLKQRGLKYNAKAATADQSTIRKSGCFVHKTAELECQGKHSFSNNSNESS